MFMFLVAPNNSVHGVEVFRVCLYQLFSHLVAARETLPIHPQNYYFVCELIFFFFLGENKFTCILF